MCPKVIPSQKVVRTKCFFFSFWPDIEDFFWMISPKKGYLATDSLGHEDVISMLKNSGGKKKRFFEQKIRIFGQKMGLKPA